MWRGSQGGRRSWVVGALVAIVGVRLGLHVVLYASGFQSLTADEFARVIRAARWAEDPFWPTQGAWLPLFPCLYGAELWAWWDLVWAPRGLTILFGVAAVVAMAWLTRMVVGSWRHGLVAGGLLAVSPGHLWLSSTPLSGAAYTAFAIAALAFLMRHLRRGGAPTVLASAAFLGLACGLRYEGWMLAIPYTGLLLYRAARRRCDPPTRWATCAAALLPWTIPALWIGGHWLATGDPLHFVHAIRDYKLRWYGGETAWDRYLQTFLRLDPFVTVLAPIGAALALRARRRDPPPAILATVCLAALGVFVALHRGQVESVNNSVRYLGPFLFLAYPLAVLVLARVRLPTTRAGAAAVAGLALLAVGWQLRGALAFVPDGNAAGLAVGRRLQELRAADGLDPPRPAMIELTYWSYLAIHVGANDVDRILYDRPLDLERRASRSLIFWDWPAVAACIARDDVGYIAARTPELRAVLHRRLGTAEGVTVGRWEIVPVPEELRAAGATVDEDDCPLPPPVG